MANLNAKKNLAAVVLAAATFATPALAHAQNYSKASYKNDCSTNTEEQVIAGTIGAVLGGVLGSQAAGNGARTEGSVLGAVIGGAAGAAIADGNNDCDKIRNRSTYRTTSDRGYDRGYTTNRTVYTSPRVTTVHHRDYGSRGLDNRRGYGFRNDPVDRINRRMDYLRKERAQLKRDQSYFGYSRRIDRRLNRIAHELNDLKQRKRQVKKVERRRSKRHYSDRHYRGY